MGLRRLILSLACLLAPAGAHSQAPPESVCADGDKTCAARAVQDHVVRRLDHWQRALALPLEQRMTAAPPELAEYLVLDNIKDGIAHRPRPAAVPQDLLRDAQAALAGIPPGVRTLLKRKLAGIYFVEDLGGTGYTDVVRDSRGNAVAGFVALDASVLAKQTANAWATWKESTPFVADSRHTLAAEIEKGR